MDNNMEYNMDNNMEYNMDNNMDNMEYSIIMDNQLTKEDIVINYFFKDFIYYYNITSGIYFNYINDNFVIINENELIYNILSYISIYRNIFNINTNLKLKIKNKIHKIIKTKSIYDNIPNSLCIQNIINFFYPNFLNDKEYSKYFLITIGDIIMKKTKQIYYVPLYLKPFLINLNKYISLFFHSINIFNWFKFNKVKKNISELRIFKMNNININYFIINYQFFIDIICVSIHYSCRHKSGELFLNSSLGLFKNDIILNHKTKKDILNKFLEEYIIINNINYIHKKDMIFIWKSYISTNNLINIFTNSELLLLLCEKFNHNNNNFIGVTSKYLPYVINFKEFWDSTIEYDNDDEYEISELLMLYHNNYNDKITINEFKNLIKYYHPSIYILKNKHVMNIKCSLWNKKRYIEKYKNNNINVNDLYTEYCKTTINYKVSKNYFIKYIK
tara:strand:- start:5979 stop:7313 length:1335 start_codon:yes stop_codon:yes gene_type:complete